MKEPIKHTTQTAQPQKGQPQQASSPAISQSDKDKKPGAPPQTNTPKTR